MATQTTTTTDTSHSTHVSDLAPHQHRTFVFIKDDLSYTVNTPDGQHTLLYIHSEKSFWLPSSAKSMTIHRGGPDGEQIGTVKYHGTTSLKADLALHGRNTVKWSGKKMSSGTDLGGQLEWARDEKDRLATAGTLLKLEVTTATATRTIARLATGSAAEIGGLLDADGDNGGSGGLNIDEEKYWHVASAKNNAGRFVIVGAREGAQQQQQQQFGRDQVEEIIVTGIVEHERKIKERQMIPARGGGGNGLTSVVNALVGGG